MSASDEALDNAIDKAIAQMQDQANEIIRLRHLLLVVAGMGVDPDDDSTEEWTFVEDAAQFVKDNF